MMLRKSDNAIQTFFTADISTCQSRKEQVEFTTLMIAAYHLAEAVPGLLGQIIEWSHPQCYRQITEQLQYTLALIHQVSELYWMDEHQSCNIRLISDDYEGIIKLFIVKFKDHFIVSSATCTVQDIQRIDIVFVSDSW